jgi:hypothetical protein
MPLEFPSQVADYFLSVVDDRLLRRVTEIVRIAYPAAFDQARAEFRGPVAHDYVGYRRRAIIENAFGALGGLFSDLQIEDVPNVGGGANHCELRSRRIVITQSKIDKEGGAIHEARFRSELGTLTDPGLFYNPVRLASEEVPLWAAIVHGPGSPRDRTAGFIKAVFPDENGVHTGRPSIDLYSRYPDLRPSVADLPAPDSEFAAAPTPRFLPGVLPEDTTGSEDE